MSTNRCKSCGNPTDKMSNDFIDLKMSSEDLIKKYTIKTIDVDLDTGKRTESIKQGNTCCIIAVTTLVDQTKYMLRAVPQPIYHGNC